MPPQSAQPTRTSIRQHRSRSGWFENQGFRWKDFIVFNVEGPLVTLVCLWLSCITLYPSYGYAVSVNYQSISLPQLRKLSAAASPIHVTIAVPFPPSDDRKPIVFLSNLSLFSIMTCLSSPVAFQSLPPLLLGTSSYSPNPL